MSGDKRPTRPMPPELDEAAFDGFTKTMEIYPAYDLGKTYGKHCCDLLMVLRKGDLAVQFLLYTGWYLQKDDRNEPLPADLGYHSTTPMYDDQETLTNHCPHLDNSPCYYDGSGLNAHAVYQTLLEQGSNGVWLELLQYWHDTWRRRENYAEEQRRIADLGIGHS